MALFRRKKAETEPQDNAPDAASGETSSNGDQSFKPQPEKARKWFQHAKTMADAFNYEYALTCYANGIKFDPEVMSAHEAMHEVAIKYMNAKGSKPASSRDIKQITDDTVVSRLAAAEYAWARDYRNPSLALKALDAAVKADQREIGHWIAPKVLNLIRNQKKPSKSALIQLKDLCKKIEAWDEALTAGEFVLKLDPTNSQLAHEIKELAAQRAMDQGGYEDAAGHEGGYRKFIKDADRQRELIESEAISAGESAEERNLARAKAAYEENPTVPDVINQYASTLRKRDTPEAAEEAYRVYMKGFEDTREYRFRMLAGDVKIELMRKEVRNLAEQHKANPDDESIESEFQEARRKLLETQSAEYNERVEKYPTDRFRKYELGTVEYELGNIENAMAQFQAAKDEPKLRVRAGHFLGRCFAKEDWHPEAVEEFKEALEAIDATEKERDLEIRYDLMLSLLEHAKTEQSLDTAKEALQMCSGIARKNITYRDIRTKRKEIDELIKDLSATPNENGEST